MKKVFKIFAFISAMLMALSVTLADTYAIGGTQELDKIIEIELDSGFFYISYADRNYLNQNWEHLVAFNYEFYDTINYQFIHIEYENSLLTLYLDQNNFIILDLVNTTLDQSNKTLPLDFATNFTIISLMFDESTDYEWDFYSIASTEISKNIGHPRNGFDISNVAITHDYELVYDFGTTKDTDYTVNYSQSQYFAIENLEDANGWDIDTGIYENNLGFNTNIVIRYEVEPSVDAFNPDDWFDSPDGNTYYVGALPTEVDQVVMIHFDPSLDVTDYEYGQTSASGHTSIPADTTGIELKMTIDQATTVHYHMTLYPSGNIIKTSDTNTVEDWGSISIRRLSDDTTAPIFDGELNYITTVDNPITEANLRAQITAYDDVDGDITSDITIIEDNYSANRGTIGAYTITYSVSDTAGNTTSFVITVNQYDVIAPGYSAVPLTLNYGSDETFVPLDYLSDLNFTDNYDAYVDLDIQISDNYTANKTVVGSYTVVYTAIDTSGNTRVVTVTINVVDENDPIITGLDSFHKNNNVSVKAKDLISMLTALDDYDGDVTSSIYVLVDNYKDTRLPGTYTVTYAAIDSSGNVGTLDVTFTVTDVINPVAYVINGNFFTVDELNQMSTQEIIDILIATGQLDPGTLVSVESDTYTINSSTPGLYSLSLSITNGTETSLYDLYMNVVNSDFIQDAEDEQSWFSEHVTEIILGGFVLVLIAVILKKK